MKTINVMGQEVPAAKLLAALYNRSKPVTHGRLDPGPKVMTETRAQDELERRGAFNFLYLYDRPMSTHEYKGRLTDQDRRNYDSEAGQGEFMAAVAEALGT